MYHIKNDKRSVQSGEFIYSALAELMNEKKYEDITVTELVDKAKLGRATFYRNFDNIEDVLRMKCDKAFTDLRDYLIKYYNKENRSKGLLMAPFIKPFLRYWYINSEIIELLINANRFDILNEAFATMFKNFGRFVTEPVDIISNHFDYFVAIRTGAAINILIQWIKNDKNIAPDDLTDLLIKQMEASFNLNLLL